MAIARALAVIVLSGLLGTALVRFAPGSDADEREMDVRFSRESVEQIRQERGGGDRSPIALFASHLFGLVQGSAGMSTMSSRPVGEMVAERFEVTARAVAVGVMVAWVAALGLGATVSLFRNEGMITGAALLTATTLSVPAGLLALACLLLSWPTYTAIAAVVFPRVYPHVFAQFQNALGSPAVIFGRSRGLSRGRLLACYLTPLSAAPLIALAAVSIPFAVSVSVPVEAVADVPGIGQLAWKAALARDLPVLVTVVLLLTVVTVSVNLMADVLVARLPLRRS
jgi:peptide/nickel transport system permease protein